jgi:hypothetical protein
VNSNLTCGRCSRLVRDLRDVCPLCGRYLDAVLHDVEARVDTLLRRHTELDVSTDIYAEYNRALVEQELRTYGIDPSAPSGERSTTVRTGRKGFGSRG